MAEQMKYILGIDQGGSKTHAVVGDKKGHILGFGESHGACHTFDGMNPAMNAVSEAVKLACVMSGIGSRQITTVAAGMTGADWDFEIKLLRDAIYQLLTVEDVTVYNDCIPALRAGTKKSYGAVICAGSGLNCAVTSPKGEEFIYGYYIDDEYQGGRGLANTAYREVIEASVGLRGKTMLTKLILEYLGLPSAEELLFNKVNGKISEKQSLYMPKIIDKAADSGDKAAEDILCRFGKQFGFYIKTALERMDLTETPMDVVLSGGIFKCVSPYLRQGISDVLSPIPSINMINAVYEPVIGAYLLSLDQLENMNESVYANIEKSAVRYRLKR